MRSLLAAAFIAAVSLVPVAPALAFDTGPHATITEDSLNRAGFNRAAADAVQVENWLTDYFTSRPFFGSDAQCALEKLHFDDVFSNGDIASYWTTLAANTKAAAQQAERDNDVVEFYTVLGMSLHVVQDFYSHSNWVEQSGASGAYKTTSWFETSSPPSGLYTGWYANCLKIPQGSHVPHGGYTSGLNHDSVVRPRYDRAYVYALGASYEWTQNVLGWVSSGFASRVKTYSPSASDAKDLAYDQKASLYISEWIALSGADGHWNGNRSGYGVAFAKFILGWTGSHDSVYVRTFKQKALFTALSRGLYQPAATPPPMPAFTAHPTSGTVFAMRTLSVNANFAAGTESYYGTLVPTTIGNGYGYRDASQYHLPRTAVPWLQLILVPPGTSSITFQYSLWNEWNTTNNDLVPISGGNKTLLFVCSVASAGCTTGGPWSQANPYVTKGSGFKGVELKLYFSSTPAAP
jgi:hypothetical protein